MSQANLDLVRSIYAEWESGDFSSAEWAHPEIEYVFADGPEPSAWAGLAELTEGFRNFLDAWEEYGVEVDECRAVNGERVLVLFQSSGRGRASGLDLGQIRAKGAFLFHLRGDKVRRIVVYWDRERALADLGLGPECGSER